MREEQQRLTRTVMDLRTRIERLRDTPAEAQTSSTASETPRTDQGNDVGADASDETVTVSGSSSDDAAPDRMGRGPTWV